MKKTLSLLLLSATLITACKKSSNTQPTTNSGPTTLLTKIINNTAGNPGFGKSFIEFTYNGKQLTKEVIYYYNANVSLNNAQTNVFNYNSQGNLIGTTITNSNSSGYVSDGGSTTITANGNNISEIKLYQPNNVLADDITFTYQNGKVATSTSPLSYLTTYTYDSNGNNTHGYYQNVTNTMFDGANSLSSAIPYWQYFAYIQFSDGYMQGVPLYPGAHNVANFNNGTTNYSYTYQYNSYNYPSMSTSTVIDYYSTTKAPYSFQYQYTQVN